MSAYDEGFIEVARGELSVNLGKGELVILGMPSPTADTNNPDYHNCDAMGCGQSHVVFRAFFARLLVSPPETPPMDQRGQA